MGEALHHLDVVICTRDRHERLTAMLTCLSQQITDRQLRIYIVDTGTELMMHGHSTLAHLMWFMTYVRGWVVQQTKYYWRSHERRISEIRSFAFSLGTGPRVLTLDDDILFGPNLIEKLSVPMDTYDVGYVLPNMREFSQQRRCVPNYDAWMNEQTPLVDNLLDAELEHFCCVLFDRAKFDKQEIAQKWFDKSINVGEDSFMLHTLKMLYGGIAVQDETVTHLPGNDVNFPGNIAEVYVPMIRSWGVESMSDLMEKNRSFTEFPFDFTTRRRDRPHPETEPPYKGQFKDLPMSTKIRGILMAKE